ncbi:MAG: hypothetical protein ACREGB_01505, partial [Candidatus Saccharimonadales bacterium]
TKQADISRFVCYPIPPTTATSLDKYGLPPVEPNSDGSKHVSSQVHTLPNALARRLGLYTIKALSPL